MANQINLVEWLLSQNDGIDFKVTEYTWVEDFAPEYSDFGVTFGTEISGRAIDKDGEISLIKAVAEAIERATCIHNGLTKSTGVAAHPSREVAFEIARRELIERAAFDIHFSQRKPLRKAEAQTTESKKASLALAKFGIQLSFFSLVSPPGLTVICAVASGEKCLRPFGGIFGLGCHEDIAEAERAALFESLRNAAYYTRDEDIESLSVAEFERIDSPKFFDRFRLALDTAYHQQISFLFDDRIESDSEFPKLTYGKKEIAKAPEFSEAPISVVRVTSDYQFSSAASSLPSFMD